MVDHIVSAVNDANESENKIHDDGVAQTYGFRGGLVPGVTVYGYLTYPAADRWGAAWLERGTIAARFQRPVYEGEKVVITGVDGPDGALELACHTDAGELCASGRASLPSAPVAAPDPADFPVAPLPEPDDRPPAGATLTPGLVLGTFSRPWRATDNAAFLGVLSDDLSLYDGGRMAHPGWLVRAANDVLWRTVRMGPWIHVSTDAVHHGLVTDGEVVSTAPWSQRFSNARVPVRRPQRPVRGG